MKRKDPYEENIPKKCIVCESPVMVDQFGQGPCKHCGWYQSRDDGQNPTAVIYPNLVSLERARLLVQEGSPLVPTLDDFANGFNYYGEVQFNYKGYVYGVVRADDEGGVEFFQSNNADSIQLYKNKEEFMEKATINDLLLKDIWDEVENASYM